LVIKYFSNFVPWLDGGRERDSWSGSSIIHRPMERSKISNIENGAECEIRREINEIGIISQPFENLERAGSAQVELVEGAFGEAFGAKIN